MVLVKLIEMNTLQCNVCKMHLSCKIIYVTLRLTVQCLAWYTLTSRLQFLWWQCKRCSIRILVLITPPSSEPSRISIEWAGPGQPLQPHNNIARPADCAQLRALASSPCRGWPVGHLHVSAIADTPESRPPLMLKMKLKVILMLKLSFISSKSMYTCLYHPSSYYNLRLYLSIWESRTSSQVSEMRNNYSQLWNAPWRILLCL